MFRLLAAVALFPFDDVLRGMVKAGQGAEALCLILGLTRSFLHDHLARLGLPTPHDRPMRQPGARGWTVWEKTCLVFWRSNGVHPEIIGKKLRGRTAGAVRAQCRRLGIPAPPRKSLHKPDPDSLRDPEPGFAWRNPGQSPAPATPGASCGRVAGVITWRGRDEVKTVPQVAEKATSGEATGLFGGFNGQRELPLFGVVGGTDRGSLKAGSEQNDRRIARLARSIPEIAIPKTEEEVDFSGDLTWIGKMRRPLTNKLIVWTCGMLLMSGLHYAEAARRVGMTTAGFRTFRTRSGIPVDEDRKKYDRVLDEQIARDTLAESGYKLRHCMTASQCRDGKGNWFWVERNDHSTRLSPPKRKRDYWSEGRYNKITILKGKDARRPLLEIMTPFAKSGGRNRDGSNSWSAAYA